MAKCTFFQSNKIHFTCSARNLGVTPDRSLKLNKSVSAVMRNNYFHLRTISQNKALLLSSSNRENCGPCLYHISVRLLQCPRYRNMFRFAAYSWFIMQLPASLQVKKNTVISPRFSFHFAGFLSVSTQTLNV